MDLRLNQEKNMMILETIFVSTFLFVLSSSQNDTFAARKPPTITRSPSKSIIYRSDESITLVCRGEGVPTLSYEWKKNGIKLSQTVRNIQRSIVDGTLTIHPATLVDEGFYQCFAMNQYGVAMSHTVHLQRAFLGPITRNTTDVLNITVQEGKPFHILAEARKSFPKGICSWETTNNTADINPIPLRLSRRTKMAENGDLYFSYAVPLDDLVGRFYRCSTYNPYLDVKAAGSYTQLTVIRNSSAIDQFSPTLLFSSNSQTVALIGESLTLKCFFSGYPEPTITWSGPRNTLPVGRYTLNSFNTELVINNITATDQGDYTCTGSNTQGRNTHTLQIRVEAVPAFINVRDGPYDVNATEGESVKFSCNASAKPEAKIVWFQDGKELDPYNPPKRFSFSSDNRSLTIRDVCRDCVDRERKTDLMVIQCNASNVHGYAFGQGYLNVLIKTRVIIEGQKDVVVSGSHEQQIQFTCIATSDPTTPPHVRWYKVVNNKEELVHDNPPDVILKNGTLVINFNPNNTRHLSLYLGNYRCIGDNGYSRDVTDVNIVESVNITPAAPEKAKSRWWIYVVLGVSCGVVLLLVIVTGVICVRRGSGRNRSGRRGAHEMGARRCDYVRTSDLGPFRRDYPTDETTLTSSSLRSEN